MWTNNEGVTSVNEPLVSWAKAPYVNTSCRGTSNAVSIYPDGCAPGVVALETPDVTPSDVFRLGEGAACKDFDVSKNRLLESN